MTTSKNAEVIKIWRGMRFDRQAIKLNLMAAYGVILSNTISNGANQTAMISGR